MEKRKIRTLLVDDMALALASLKQDLEEGFSERIDVVGTANSVIDAAKQVKLLNPDLIFLDIHMGDGNGFDLLQIIDNVDIKIIFTTASADFAIQAFQVSAVDYLLKPIDTDLLAKAIEKVTDDDDVSLAKSDYLSLSTQEEIRKVAIEDIIRIEAMGNYSQFYINDGTKLLVTKTLKSYIDLLGDAFIRVHQSHLINKKYIHAYVKQEGGYLLLTDKTQVPVSVRKKVDLLEYLSK